MTTSQHMTSLQTRLVTCYGPCEQATKLFLENNHLLRGSCQISRIRFAHLPPTEALVEFRLH